MVSPNIRERDTSSYVRELCCREMVIVAGSNEMDVNEFTVMPCRWPSWAAVTTVTPADQARMAARKFSESRVILVDLSNVNSIIIVRQGSVKQ